MMRKLQDGWHRQLQSMTRSITSRLNIKSLSVGSLRSSGLILAFIDVMFHTESLPPYEVPTGTILTDGLTVIFRTVDISEGRAKLLVARGADPGDADFRELFASAAEGTAAFKRDAHRQVNFGTHYRIINNGNLLEAPIIPTINLNATSLGQDRLGEATRRAGITGRRFKDNPSLALPRTTDGLPNTIANLTHEWAVAFLADHGLSKADIEGGDFAIAANDPGIRFDQAITARVNVKNDWVLRHLLSRPTGEQGMISDHQRKLHFLKIKERSKLNVIIAPDVNEVLCQTSYPILRARYDLRRMRRQHLQRKVDQLAHTLGFLRPGTRPTRPANLITASEDTLLRPTIFALGAAHGSMSHVKRHGIDTRNSFLRRFIHLAKAHRWPILPAFVSEHLTSQLCPDSACRAKSASIEDLPRYVISLNWRLSRI